MSEKAPGPKPLIDTALLDQMTDNEVKRYVIHVLSSLRLSATDREEVIANLAHDTAAEDKTPTDVTHMQKVHENLTDENDNDIRLAQELEQYLKLRFNLTE